MQRARPEPMPRESQAAVGSIGPESEIGFFRIGLRGLRGSGGFFASVGTASGRQHLMPGDVKGSEWLCAPERGHIGDFGD